MKGLFRGLVWSIVMFVCESMFLRNGEVGIWGVEVCVCICIIFLPISIKIYLYFGLKNMYIFRDIVMRLYGILWLVLGL